LTDAVPIVAAACVDPGQTGNEADLSISGVFTPNPGRRNNEVTLTLTVRNGGPAFAKDVVITLPTPSGSTIRSVAGSSPGQNVVGTSTVRIPLGELRRGSVATANATFFVFAEMTSITTNPTVSGSVADPYSSNNSSLITGAIVGTLTESSAERLIASAEVLLKEPFPQFRGNWLSDVVLNYFDKTAYQTLYTEGVNLRNLAANQLALAKRFYGRNDPENAHKYARLAMQYIVMSDQAFVSALDAYNGKIQKAISIVRPVHFAGSVSLSALAALGCGTPCLAIKHLAEGAVDWSESGWSESGFTEALKARAVDIVLEKIVDDSLLRRPDLSAMNQFLGKSGLYEWLLSIFKNPEFTKQLMPVIAAGLNLSQQASEDYVVWLIRSLLDAVKAPVYIEPGPGTSSTAADGIGGLERRASADSAAELVDMPWPALYEGGVVSAADYAGWGVSPGEIVTIFGDNLGPATLTVAGPPDGGIAAKSIAEAQVFFDGVPAPVLYVASGQIGVIVPYDVAGESSTRVQVEYRGVRSFPIEVPVLPSVPGIFSLDNTGRGRGAVLNQDGTINSPVNAAVKGSVVSVYATGGGQTQPWGVDGRITMTVLPKPLLPVLMSVGGVLGEVTYAGAAPGFVAGVMQINVRIPFDVAPGPVVPLTLSIGDASSPQLITISVQ
jgi:uncharacterized protein (TIGR03437 family)